MAQILNESALAWSHLGYESDYIGRRAVKHDDDNDGGTVIHNRHYLTVGGGHYKLSNGSYYQCKA